MASQVVKLYLRLKGTKHESGYSIDHRNFQFGSESCVFQDIFTEESTQEELFESLGKPLVENVMRGSNGILLTYGATGSGKTYSLLGGAKQDGLVPKILEEIFLRAKILKSKKTIVVVFSCFEIDGDRIRDLAKILSDGKHRLDQESLEVREYQGNVYIDNLSVAQIEDIGEAVQMIEEGRRQRKMPDLNISNQSQVHTVLKITVSQKEMNVSKAGILTVVDLADSNSGLESINRSLETLRSLILDLQKGHHASSDESTLTKVLATNLKNNCLISMLFQLDLSQEHQSIDTLKYSNNCYTSAGSTSAENILFKSHQQSHRIKKIQDEIIDLKHKIDKTQEIHEGKLRGFGDILGFNLDVENLIHAYPGSKERRSMDLHLNSCETLDEVENRNRRLEAKLNKNCNMFDEIHKFELKNRAKNAEQIKSLEDQIKEIKIQIIELSDKIQENVRKQVSIRTDELQRVLLSNHMELEEKAAVIHNLPFTLQSIASDMRAIVDYKEMGKAELEYQLVRQYQDSEESHNKNVSKIKTDTEHGLKQLDQEARRFEIECNNYIRDKFEKIKKFETELVGCYEVYLDQEKLIKDIEAGVFNNGIKPIYITVHDIPKPPQREKYP